MSELDLSDVIRNTHAATLTQGDLNAWARAAGKLESRVWAADIAVAEARFGAHAAESSRNVWRFFSLLGLGIWILFAMAACSSDEPTVTMPLSFCHDRPTGVWQHQHRSGYSTVVMAGKVPITQYHPSRDWDEQRYVRTCALQEWREEVRK